MWNYNKSCITGNFRETEICYGKKSIIHIEADEQENPKAIPYLSPMPANATDRYLEKLGRL